MRTATETTIELGRITEKAGEIANRLGRRWSKLSDRLDRAVEDGESAIDVSDLADEASHAWRRYDYALGRFYGLRDALNS